MQQTLFCIVNPNAGGGKGGKDWPVIEKILKENLVDFDYAFTTAPWQAVEIVKNAIQKKNLHLVAIGGDGTLNEVLNGVMLQQIVDPLAVSIGKINVGTGNDWGKTYGLKNDFKENIQRLVAGNTVCQDICLVRWLDDSKSMQRYFINIAGAGYDAEVVETVNRNAKKGSNGTLTYLFNLLKCLFNFTAVPYKLELDGKEINGKLFSLGVGICKYNGNGMMQLPFAIPDDGLMDITVINHISNLDVLRNIKGLYDGSFVKHPAVNTYTGKHLRFHSESPVKFEADGESLGLSPFEIELFPKAINVMV